MSIKFFLLLFVLLFIPLSSARALYDPRLVRNNQFGIHVIDANEVPEVGPLINSSGGEWGYVKFVIPESDRNTGKWTTIFRELRRKKLIPIVRIATKTDGPVWTQPTDDSIADWPAFLNSLPWPIENRYVVLFNEPNHAAEWGGELNPTSFGQKTVQLARKLKEANPDYFILPAGLDVSAESNGGSMDAYDFLKKVIASNPEFLQVIDGWTSHSYPNPAFSAPPSKTGRGSLWSFQDELSFLKTLGLTKDLPVLIGETGWVHEAGILSEPRYNSPETVASYIKTAGETVWTDSRIFAVIPFVYSYQGQPFDHFSWKKFGVNEFHPQYYSYQQLKKPKGEPKQYESYAIENTPLPSKLIAGSLYTFPLEIKNTGQKIISSQDLYYLFYEDTEKLFSFIVDGIPTLEPDQSTRLQMSVRTPEKLGSYKTFLKIQNLSTSFPLLETDVAVLPPPSLNVSVQLGWQKQSNDTTSSVLIYDGNKLLHEFKNLPVTNGIIATPGILGIVPDQNYRIVTLIPYYLPRQVIQPIGEQLTYVENKRFFPFDINNDQKLTIDDFIALLKEQPKNILPRFFNL